MMMERGPDPRFPDGRGSGCSLLEPRFDALRLDFGPIDRARDKIECAFWTGSFEAMVRVTVRAFGVPRERILSGDRHRSVSEARQALMWTAREVTSWSIELIGRRIGRDHTTVLHGLKRARERRASNHRFRALTDAMAEALRAATPPVPEETDHAG